MEMNPSETRIVQALAESVCQRVARRTITALQSMSAPNMLLSGEDSGLTNVWDEICVQLQNEYSYSWGAYVESMRAMVDFYVEELPTWECEAVWLQTPEGDEWDCEDEDEREPYPVISSDITNYILNDYVLSMGNDWSTPRIRAYLNRCYLASLDR